MSTKHDFMLQLSGDDLVSLKIALQTALEKYEQEPPHYTIADAHPDSSIGRMVRMQKALDDAMHGRHNDKCKVHWTKEQYAALTRAA